MITSPIAIYLPRINTKDRRIALNLNIYRNLHYQINNHIKDEYRKLMASQLTGVVYENGIDTLEMHLYKPSKRKIDRSNILCIVEKFFCDAMVYYGCIPDDNDDHIGSTIYKSLGIDKKNPRVEIFIKGKNDKR